MFTTDFDLFGLSDGPNISVDIQLIKWDETLIFFSDTRSQIVLGKTVDGITDDAMTHQLRMIFPSRIKLTNSRDDEKI